MKSKSFVPNNENQNNVFVQPSNSYMNYNQDRYTKNIFENRHYAQHQRQYQNYIPEKSNAFIKTPQKYTKRSHLNSYNEADDYSGINQKPNAQNFSNYSGNQQKKYRAKDQYMQTKLSNISNYQIKIQSLLQIVNKSPFTAKNQNQACQKPYKNSTKQKQTTNHKIQRAQKSHQILIQRQRLAQTSNAFAIPNVDLHRRKHKRELSKQEEQYTRKKSKQYMKSIQKQVKQITRTVVLLNQKINKNDKITFKKEINFDDLENQVQKPEVILSSLKKREHFSKFYQDAKSHQVSCFQFENNDRKSDRVNTKSIQCSYQQYKLRKKTEMNMQQNVSRTPNKKKNYKYEKEFVNAQNSLTPSSSSKKAGQIYKQDHWQKQQRIY